MDALVINTHEDAIAAVPQVLGFHPKESLVLVPFDQRMPWVRVDIPTSPEQRDGLWDNSLGDALTPHARRAGGAARVAVLSFTQDRDNAEVASEDLSRRLGEIGVQVPVRLWTNGFAWAELNTGDHGRISQDTADRMAAIGVMQGRPRPVESREAMAATMVGDREPVAAHLDAARGRDTTPGAEREWALDRLDQFLDDGVRLSDPEAARLLVAMENTATRDALWNEMSRDTATGHQSLWMDMTRRAPDEVRAPAASMAGFSSWLAGDGAKAWCALDQVPAQGQPYPMAAIVAGAVESGLPPSEWEANRPMMTGLAAELDESFVPRTPHAPEQRGPGPSHEPPTRGPGR